MDIYKKIVLMSRLQEKLQTGRRFILIFYFSLYFCCCLYGKPDITDNKGNFVFKYGNSGKVRNVKVYYYAPERLMQNSRIVFVLHGDSRSGSRYCDEWQQYAIKYNFLVLCPELSEKDFSFWDYNCGNIYDNEKKRFNPKEEWTFNLIEQLFDFVREDRKMKIESYCIFGHSSGAQLVQRMVLFMPEARFSLAIANGAGWYTLPNFKFAFYDGLKGTLVTEKNLKEAFEKKLIILMGAKDFVSKTRPPSYAATRHKWDRVWRAKFFYKDAKTKSEQMGTELNWIYKTVPDVDHIDPKHALWASRYVAKSPKNIFRKVHGERQKPIEQKKNSKK